jgi:alpha-beta hydrolase superfamily lysophospholipase
MQFLLLVLGLLCACVAGYTQPPLAMAAHTGRASMEATSQAATSSRTWAWRGASIHYEIAESADEHCEQPPLLLLPGFGVGTFHFQRNLPQLAHSLQRPVYTLDLLGQGLSWPVRAPTADDALVYSVKTWQQQIETFIEEVITEPVYLAGNSLGGYLSVCVAAAKPELCKGTLLTLHTFRIILLFMSQVQLCAAAMLACSCSVLTAHGH